MGGRSGTEVAARRTSRGPALLSTLATAFDPSELRGQFVLGRSVSFRPGGWQTSSLEGWDLVHAPDLPVVDLSDEGGTRLGWLLGTPLVPGQDPVQGPQQLSFRAASEGFDTRFDAWLYGFAGQFAAILVAPSPCIYIDAYSSLPVLFDGELGLASSSPFLLTHDGSVPDSGLQSEFDITKTGYWHILGTTPHARAERLLPNHVLHLDTWDQQRHWPTAPLEVGEDGQLTEGIADVLRGTLEAAAALGPTPSVSLTAGGDTRAMLACSRPILDRLMFFTVAFPDDSGRTDVRTAANLASRFELGHRVIEWVQPEARDVDLYLYRTGCLIGELRGMRAARSYAQLDPDAAYVSGVGGVIATDTRDLGLDPRALARPRVEGAELVARFGWPVLPELVARAERWLAELPVLDLFNIHLLFRLEMYYGCWGGPLALGYPDACRTTVYPYGQRAVIERLMRMTTTARSDGIARRRVIESRWPELLDIPLNPTTLPEAARRRARRARVTAGAAARRAETALAAMTSRLRRRN